MRLPTYCHCVVLAVALSLALPAAANNTLGGVNLSGAEFGSAVPGSVDHDYTWPTTAELDYFHAQGMNVARIPFLWERMQPIFADGFDG